MAPAASRTAPPPAATRTGRSPAATRTAPSRSTTKADAAAAKKQAAAEKAERDASVRRRALALARAEADEDFAALEEGSVAPEDEHSDGHVTDEEADAAAPATSSDVEPDALVIGNDSDDDDQDATGITVADALPVTPVKRRRAVHDDGEDVEGVADKKAYKVVGGEFTPRTRRLGEASKKELRRVTATENPYPGTLNRTSHVEAIIKQTAESSRLATDETRATLRRVMKMPVRWGRLVNWVLYARGGLINEFIKKARMSVGTLGVPGTMSPAQIQETIAWLLRTEAWKFGGLDVNDQSYDMKQPFKAAFFGAVPRTMYLEGRGKADSEIFRDLLEVQAVPKVMLAMTMTAVEHALTEWREGTFKIADFKEAAASRYMYHLSGWETLEANAPRYALKVQGDLFKTMLIHSNKTFLLESTKSDSMSNLDFTALEALA